MNQHHLKIILISICEGIIGSAKDMPLTQTCSGVCNTKFVKVYLSNALEMSKYASSIKTCEARISISKGFTFKLLLFPDD